MRATIVEIGDDYDLRVNNQSFKHTLWAAVSQGHFKTDAVTDSPRLETIEDLKRETKFMSPRPIKKSRLGDKESFKLRKFQTSTKKGWGEDENDLIDLNSEVKDQENRAP